MINSAHNHRHKNSRSFSNKSYLFVVTLILIIGITVTLNTIYVINLTDYINFMKDISSFASNIDDTAKIDSAFIQSLAVLMLRVTNDTYINEI